MDNPNTKFTYFYRDSGNYKQYQDVIFPGILDDYNTFRQSLHEGEYFIPSVVGLNNLQSRFGNGWDASSDHPYHEIASIEKTSDSPTESLSIQSFLDKFQKANWEEEANKIIMEQINGY